MSKIAFVTYRAQPRMTTGDSLMYNPLAEHGLKLMAAPWDDLTIRWTDFALVVLRSPWDYHTRLPEFMEWLDLLEEEDIPVWNPISLLRWNANKLYLKALYEKNISIVPTEFVQTGEVANLNEILTRRNWAQAIVKPTIGAGASKLWQVNLAQAERHQKKFDKALASDSLMVQPLLQEIVTNGELSFMYFRNWQGEITFSHAVVKRPKENDIRVQEEFGGQTMNMVVSPEIQTQVDLIAHSIQDEWLYMRVDGVIIEGVFHLMELELLEPELFLDYNKHAPKLFATAIASFLD